MLSTFCHASVPIEVLLLSKSPVCEQAMKSFSLVYLAAIVAIVASTNGAQADSPVAGADDGTLAQMKEIKTTWTCYYGDKFLGSVQISDEPQRPVGRGFAAKAGGVLPSHDLAASLCNQSFGGCNNYCQAV